MQLFAITCGPPGAGDAPRVERAVRDAARAFPGLTDGSLRSAASTSGRLALAALAHPERLAGPRRYFERRGDTAALFDGLPIDPDGRITGHDAGAILDDWALAKRALDGIFSAVRVDLAGDVVEVMLDPLGLSQVFCWQRGEEWIVSNSVDAIRTLASATALDPIGVSSLLALGWPIGGHTLLAGVRVLPGGHVWRFAGSRRSGEPYLTPATTAPRVLRESAHDAGAVAARLTRVVESAARVGSPVRCGITGGRDSRVVLGLAMAAGVPLRCYTVGRAGDEDVELAGALARRLELPHEVWLPTLPASLDEWARSTTQFALQTNGLNNSAGIADWVDNRREPEPLAVKLWGVGGEIGRTANRLGPAIAANAPLARSSMALQRRMVARKLQAGEGPHADAVARELNGFLDTLRNEGWRAREVLDGYHAFERVTHWAAAGPRRASATTDLVSPFATRDFIEYGLSLTAGERFVETSHHALLTLTAPELLDLPSSKPWQIQRPALAPLLVLREAAAKLAGRRPSRPAHAVEIGGRRFDQFGHAWCEYGVSVQREALLSTGDSPLWDFVSRSELERVVSAAPADRAPHLEWLCRVLSAFWFLHPSATA